MLYLEMGQFRFALLVIGSLNTCGMLMTNCSARMQVDLPKSTNMRTVQVPIDQTWLGLVGTNHRVFLHRWRPTLFVHSPSPYTYV